MSSVTIDRPREADYPEWRRLYQGYADFYRVPMDDGIARRWRRGLPRAGPGWAATAYHPSVSPDAPEGWERDQELKEALDAA